MYISFFRTCAIFEAGGGPESKKRLRMDLVQNPHPPPPLFKNFLRVCLYVTFPLPRVCLSKATCPYQRANISRPANKALFIQGLSL